MGLHKTIGQYLLSIGLGLCLLINNSHAQGDSLQRLYPFLRLQKNFILSDQPILNNLWAKIDQHKSSHIVHIGDSHIQADFFSGTVRELFKENGPGKISSRGFAFPYKLAESNNPFDYQVSFEGVWKGARAIKPKHFSRWGIATMTARTFYPETSTFTIHLGQGDSLIYTSDLIKIYYPCNDPKMFDLVLMEGEKEITGWKTDQYLTFKINKPQRSFTFKVKKRNAQQKHLVLQGVEFFNSQVTGLRYSSIGGNGNKVTTYFRCLDFLPQLKALAPDVIIISLGTNDAYDQSFTVPQFASNYLQLIQRIKMVLPNTPILLTTPGDAKLKTKLPNPNNKAARDTILKLAQKEGLAVWDFYNIMGGESSIEKWGQAGLCGKDNLHLTIKGYRIQGLLLYQALMGDYQKYKRAASVDIEAAPFENIVSE